MGRMGSKFLRNRNDSAARYDITRVITLNTGVWIRVSMCEWVVAGVEDVPEV